MTAEVWLAYVAAVAVLLVIPGPTILTVIGYSLADGPRSRLALVAGVALGDATALLLSLLGLGALLAASAGWFAVVKTVGGLYLVWLGIGLLRAGIGVTRAALPAAPESRWRVFANTWLVTALNPKGIVFFVAFLPQFIAPDRAVAPQMWILAVTFVAMAIINAWLYARFAAKAQQLLAAPGTRRGFHLGGGALLAGAGVWALLARRPG